MKMLRNKQRRVPMETFTREYVKHEDLYNKACKTDRYKRLIAYQTLARNLNISPWQARNLEKQSRKAFYAKMQSLVRHGLTDFNDLPKEPGWLRLVESKLNILPTLLREQAARVSRPAPDEVVRALCTQAARRGALCARDSYALVARALRLAVPVHDLHAAWVAAQRVSMRYLALTSRAGDNPKTALSLSHAQVADVVLLHTDVKTQRLVTDESDRAYPEATALLFLWQLVCAHRLEERAPPRSRVRAQRWTRAYRDYLDSNRLASLVVLQRRWYELKLRTRTRMRARLGARYRCATEYNSVPAPPTALDVDIVRRYPYIVSNPLPSWRSLVRTGNVITQLLSDDDSDQEADKNTNGGPEKVATASNMEPTEDARLDQETTETMDQDVMITESHSSNLPCRTTRGPFTGPTTDVHDVTFDMSKPAIEEVLKNIDPSTVKTEVIIESDPEIEPYDTGNKIQNDDLKDGIKTELANENQSNDHDNCDQIVVKEEPGVSMASRIIFVSDEEDNSSGKLSSEASPIVSSDVSPEASNDSYDGDVNGELSSDVNDDVSDDLSQESDEDISEAAFDAKLLMHATVKLTRIHDTPQWQAHAIDNRYIHVNNIMNNDVIVKTEMEDDDGSDIKLRYDSDTDTEYLPDNILDSDFDDDIPSKMPRLDENIAEDNLSIAKLPIDPSDTVKQMLMEAQGKFKKRKKVTKYMDVEELETSDFEEIVPMSEVQLLLQYLSTTNLGNNVPAPQKTFCCLARKHEDMNTARQWSGLPPLPPHKHDDGPCNCCCIDLCEDRAWLKANMELQSLLKDINDLLEKSKEKKKRKYKTNYKPRPRKKAKKADTQNDKDDKFVTEETKVPKAPSLLSTEDKTSKADANPTGINNAKPDTVKVTVDSNGGEANTATTTLTDGLDEWIRQKNVNNQFFQLQGVNTKDKRTAVAGSNTPKINRNQDLNTFQMKLHSMLADGTHRYISVPMEDNSQEIQTVTQKVNDKTPDNDVIHVPNDANIARTMVGPNVKDHVYANAVTSQISTAHNAVIIPPKMKDSGGGIIKDSGQNKTLENLMAPTVLSKPPGNMIPFRGTCANPAIRTTGPLLQQPVNRPASTIYNMKSDLQKTAPPPRNFPVQQRQPTSVINMPPGHIGMQGFPPIHQMHPQALPIRQIRPKMPNNPVMPIQSTINVIPTVNGINSNKILPPSQELKRHLLQNNISKHVMPPLIPRNSIGKQFSPNNSVQRIPTQVVPTATTTVNLADQIKTNNFGTTSTQDSALLSSLLANSMAGYGQQYLQWPPQPVPPPIPTPVPPPTIGLIGPTTLNTPMPSPLAQAEPVTVDLTRETSPVPECNTSTSQSTTTASRAASTVASNVASNVTSNVARSIASNVASSVTSSVTSSTTAKPAPNKIIILSSVTLNQKDLASSNSVAIPIQNGNQTHSSINKRDGIDIKSSKRPKGVVEVNESALNKIITPKRARVKSRGKSSTPETADDTASNSSDSTADPYNTGYEEWMRQKNINKQFFKPPGGTLPAHNKKHKSKQNNTLRKRLLKQKYKDIKHTSRKTCNEEKYEGDIESTSDASMDSTISISSLTENGESSVGDNSQTEVFESGTPKDASGQHNSQPSFDQETQIQNSLTIHDALEQNNIILDSAKINNEILDVQSEKTELLDTILPSIDESTSDSEQIFEDRPTDHCKILSFCPIAEAPLQNETILHEQDEEFAAQSEINGLQVRSDIETVPVEADTPIQNFAEHSEIQNEEIYSAIQIANQPVSEPSEINELTSVEIPVYEEAPSDMPLPECSEALSNNQVFSGVRELPSPLNQFLIPHSLTPAPSSTDTATPAEDTSLAAATLQQSSPLGKTLGYNPEINNEQILTQFTNNNYLTFNKNSTEINKQLTPIITTNPIYATISASNCPADLKVNVIDEKKSSQPLHIIIPERAASHFEECFITPDSLLQNPSPHLLHQCSPSITHIPTLIVGEYPRDRSNEVLSPKIVTQDIYLQNSSFIQIPRDHKTIRKFDRERSHFRQDRHFSNMLSPEILQKTHIDVQIVGEYPSNKRLAPTSQNDTTKRNELTTNNELKGKESVVLEANGKVHCVSGGNFSDIKSQPLIEVWGDYPSAQNNDIPTVIQSAVNSPAKLNEDFSKDVVASSQTDLLKEAMLNSNLDGSVKNVVEIGGDEDSAQTLVIVSEHLPESNNLKELDSFKSITSTDNQEEQNCIEETSVDIVDDSAQNVALVDHISEPFKKLDSEESNTSTKCNISTDNYTESNDVIASSASELVSPKENIFTNNNNDTLSLQEIDMDQHKEFGFTKPSLRLVQRRIADGIRKSAMFMVPSSSPGKNNIISVQQNHDKSISFDNFDEKSAEVLGLDTDLLDPVRLIIPPNKPVTFTLDHPKAVLPKSIDVAAKRKRLLSGQYDKISDQTDHQVKHFQEIPVIPNEVVAEVQKAKLKNKSKSQETAKIITVTHKCKEQKRHSFASLPPEVVIEEFPPTLMKDKLKKECPQTVTPRPRGRSRGRPRFKSVSNLPHPFLPKVDAQPLPNKPVTRDECPQVQPPIQSLKPGQKRKRGRPRTVSWPGENDGSDLDYVPVKKQLLLTSSSSELDHTSLKVATIPKINANTLKICKLKKNQARNQAKTSALTDKIKKPRNIKQSRVNSRKTLKQNISGKSKKTKNKKKGASELKLNIKKDVETFNENEEADNNPLHANDPKSTSCYIKTDVDTLTEVVAIDDVNVLNDNGPKPCYINADDETLTEDSKNVLNVKDPKPLSCLFKANMKTRNIKTVNNNISKEKDPKSIPCYIKADDEILTGNKKADAINVINVKDLDLNNKTDEEESQNEKEASCDEFNKTDQDTTETDVPIPTTITAVELNFKSSLNLPYKDLPIRKRPYLRIMHETTDASETPNPTTAPPTIPMPDPSPLDLSEADKEYIQSLKDIGKISNQHSIPASNNTPKLRVSIPISPLSLESVVKIIRLKSIHIKIPSEEYDQLKQRMIQDNRTLSAHVKPVAIPIQLQRRNSLSIMHNGRELRKDISDDNDEDTNIQVVKQMDPAMKKSQSYYGDKAEYPNGAAKLKIIATNKKVIQCIRLKRQRQRQLVMQKWASCTQLENIKPNEKLTGLKNTENMGKVGKSQVTRFSSIDGTTEWYREIRSLVESPDLSEFDFEELHKKIEETTKIHDRAASDTVRVSIEEIPLPEAAEPTALEVALNDIPLPTDLPPVEMVLMSCFEDNSSMNDRKMKEVACVADVPPKPTTPQPSPT